MFIHNTTWSQPVFLCSMLLLASVMLLTTNKANISATNLYLFCAVFLFFLSVASCHFRLSLVLFLLHFHFLFFQHFPPLTSLWVCGMISVWKSCPHAFLCESIFDPVTLNWLHDRINVSLVILVFSWLFDRVASFALFFWVGGLAGGWHDPSALVDLLWCPLQTSALMYYPPLLWPLPYCGLQLHPHCPARPRPPVSTTFSSHRLHLFIEIDSVAMMMETCIAVVGLSLN